MKVNDQEADPGCYIDGHWGQYGPDRVADVCEQFGIEVPREDDPRVWRFHAESDDPDDIISERTASLGTRTLGPEECWERHIWASDRLEERLNMLTEGGYWTWQDGEFFLVQTEVERFLYVQGTDYEDAWLQVLEAKPNEHAGYTDQYQAVELCEDSDEDDKVYMFRITVHYEPEGGPEEWTPWEITMGLDN